MYIHWEFHKIEIHMFDSYCYWEEISIELYEERRGLKVDTQLYGMLNEINETMKLWLPSWFFVNVADHV